MSLAFVASVTPHIRKLSVPSARTQSHKFTPEIFEALAKDLKGGRLPLPRVTVTDNLQQGLRAIVRNTGLISYHVNYKIDGSRPYMRLGSHNPGADDHLTVDQARNLAKVVRSLAAQGIDVQEGLHQRLVRELKDKGIRWRP